MKERGRHGGEERTNYIELEHEEAACVAFFFRRICISAAMPSRVCFETPIFAFAIPIFGAVLISSIARLSPACSAIFGD